MERFFDYIKNKKWTNISGLYPKTLIKQIIWWKFFLITIPPLLFAFPIQNLQYTLSSSFEQNSIREIQEIPLTEAQSWGRSFFSKISGIETFPMPIFYCIKNNNRFSSEGKDVSNELVNSENAGDISVNIRYPDQSDLEMLSVKRGGKNCSKKVLINGTSFLNPIKYEEPIPIKKPTFQSEPGQFSIIVEQIPNLKKDLNIEPYLKLKFPNYNYFRNVLILFVAWGFILLLFRDLRRFIIKS